jgi:hypothetical protein
MARSWWRSRSRAAVTLLVVAAAGATASAHRRDEYLQASRLAIGPDRVRIELDLTPGISVADRVLADIDTDRSGSIAHDEARQYLARVVDAISVEVDGAPLAVRVVDSGFPAVDAMRNGEGTIRIALTAAMPPLAGGAHRLHFRNTHRQEMGAYLANALVPESDRVAITSQDRDTEQQNLSVEYQLRGGTTNSVNRWAALTAGLTLVALAFVCRRSLRSA